MEISDEIQTLMLNPTPSGSPTVTGGSFTALLGLASSKSVDLLAPPFSCCSPIFPANAELVDRAARFSVFAAEESPEVSRSGEMLPEKNEREMAECSVGNKRKASEKSKLKASTKKGKKVEENNGSEKLGFVHVRARRGQATDSHSLAERARREKINARMKLLQELVPGCSKISGTALVLDEIINHVQSLQRQVEFLSMRLAAAYRTIDSYGLDSFLSRECGSLTEDDGRGTLAYLDGIANGGKQQQQQQLWIVDSQQQQTWERNNTSQSHVFVNNPSTISTSSLDSSNPNSEVWSKPAHNKSRLGI